MTTRQELQDLQAKARSNGRVASFYLKENNAIELVYYFDPKGPGRQRTSGLIIPALSFAEIERLK